MRYYPVRDSIASRFVFIICALLCSLASAVELVDVPSSVQAGKTYRITYTPVDNTLTTLILRKGSPNDLGTVATLTTSATGGAFEWTVDTAVKDGDDYALEIQQPGSSPNYSGLITVQGGGDSAASSATSAITRSPTPSRTPTQDSTPSPSVSSATTTDSSILQPSTSETSASEPTTARGSSTPSSAATATESQSESQSEPQSTPEPSSPDSNTSQSNSQGLSKGAKIGIGIGVAIGGLILALAAFSLGTCVKRNASAEREHESVDSSEKPEIDGQESTPQPPSGVVEMGSRLSQEQYRTPSNVPQPHSDATSSVELDDDRNRMELDAQSSAPSQKQLPVNNDLLLPLQAPGAADQAASGKSGLYNDPRLTTNHWA